ncbi:DUF3331 domain-containing protein [Paraburkholderia dipogonis]|uniref:DUF3331 domain-containing protein n=1 Tax=Paraburkholderia dipogonis TaxID=1211383 RepID=UPI0038BDFD70
MTIAVAWRDPTRRNHANQVWALAEASDGGRCTLSGKPSAEMQRFIHRSPATTVRRRTWQQ